MLKNLHNNQTVIYTGPLSVKNCLCDGHHWNFPPSQFLNHKASTSVYLSIIRRPDKVQGDSFGTRPNKMQISQRLFTRF